MKPLLFIACLLALSAHAQQQLTLTANLAAAGGCTTTSNMNVFCDLFQDALGTKWTSTNQSFQGSWGATRSACSTAFIRWNCNGFGPYLAKVESGALGTSYADFWFNLSTDSMANSSGVRIYYVLATDNSQIAWLQIMKDGAGALSLAAVCINSSFATTTNSAPQTISSGTWYHVGFKAAASGTMTWRMSTTDNLGSDLGSAINLTSRSPGQHRVGECASYGTISGTKLDFDSLSVDTTGYKPVEY